jgi:hypothetical protein
MIYHGAAGGALSFGERAEIQIDGGPATEANKPIDRSSYEGQIVRAFGEESAGSSTIEANDAGDGGLTAEAQYAHILALRFKETSASAGSEETP